jgi:hypothetical protein
MKHQNPKHPIPQPLRTLAFATLLSSFAAVASAAMLATPSSAQSPDLTVRGQDQVSVVALIESTLSTTATQTLFWTRDRPVSAKVGAQWAKVSGLRKDSRELLQKIRIDCQNKTYRIEHQTTYNSKGQKISDFDTGLDWAPLPPTTSTDTFATYSCAKIPGAATPPTPAPAA